MHNRARRALDSFTNGSRLSLASRPSSLLVSFRTTNLIDLASVMHARIGPARSRWPGLCSHVTKWSSDSHSLVISHCSGSAGDWQTWSRMWPGTPSATS